MRRPKRTRPRKDYERRIDLVSFQRVMGFLRWMTPELSASDVLRMMPEMNNCKAGPLAEYVRALENVLVRPGAPPLPFLVTLAVTGLWRDPRLWQDNLKVQSPDVPGAIALLCTAIDHEPPTRETLCHVADDIRATLEVLLSKGLRHAVERINDVLLGRMTMGLCFEESKGEGTQPCASLQDFIYDFRVYCFWMLARLIHEKHTWRVTRCLHCQGFFLKIRRDPPTRPSRFCSDQCRRDWHNPRRPRKGSPQ